MVATVVSMPTYEDGAYTGLVVRVGEEVPVADCTKLLVELQVDRKPGILETWLKSRACKDQPEKWFGQKAG